MNEVKKTSKKRKKMIEHVEGAPLAIHTTTTDETMENSNSRIFVATFQQRQMTVSKITVFFIKRQVKKQHIKRDFHRERGIPNGIVEFATQLENTLYAEATSLEMYLDESVVRLKTNSAIHNWNYQNQWKKGNGDGTK